MSFGEETVDLKIESQRVLSGGRWRKVSLSRLSLTMSGNTTEFSPGENSTRPQAGVESDLGMDSSAS